MKKVKILLLGVIHKGFLTFWPSLSANLNTFFNIVHHKLFFVTNPYPFKHWGRHLWITPKMGICVIKFLVM